MSYKDKVVLIAGGASGIGVVSDNHFNLQMQQLEQQS